MCIRVDVSSSPARHSMHRQSTRNLPPLYGALIASKERANFFPGIQTPISDWIPFRWGHIPICPELSLFTGCPRSFRYRIIHFLCGRFRPFVAGRRDSARSGSPRVPILGDCVRVILKRSSVSTSLRESFVVSPEALARVLGDRTKRGFTSSYFDPNSSVGIFIRYYCRICLCRSFKSLH